MAQAGPLVDSIGWGTADYCVIATPTFTIDPATDFATFDWTSAADAVTLTNCVKERVTALGYDPATAFSFITPAAGSRDLDLATTWAELQSVFTDVLFGDCVPAAKNTSGNDYQSYAELFNIATGWVDDDRFKEFCYNAGLSSGANWGFRYATGVDANGAPVLVYPNSRRTCTAGDLFNVPELLDDLLTALAHIEYIKFHAAEATAPVYSIEHKCSWQSREAVVGDGSSAGAHDPSVGFNGDPSGPDGDARLDFAEVAPASSTELPRATAETTSTLYVYSAAAELRVIMDSELIYGTTKFTSPLAGTYALHVKVDDYGQDAFHALGSGLAQGWNTVATGSMSAATEEVPSSWGDTTMDDTAFPAAAVPSFSFEVTAAPTTYASGAPIDWAVTGDVLFQGTSVFPSSHPNLSAQWQGEFSGSSASVSKTNLPEGEYTASLSATIFAGSVSEQTDSVNVTAEATGAGS